MSGVSPFVSLWQLVSKLQWHKHPSHISLGYSVAEYCCPVWARSSYADLIDTQLHIAIRLISGCLQITQLSWLPVVSKVAPPSLRRKAAIDLYATVESRTNWPVYADDFEHPPPWLASRRPMWSDMTSVDTITQWREDWLLSVLSTLHASSCVSRFVFCLQCFRLQCL